ncbi:MAG: hypothetical protein JWM52_513 [Candidatus Saccharibacteria bacterium]|nr:hypothetical protein [Candidatus Saccharibacteria bacterium]
MGPQDDKNNPGQKNADKVLDQKSGNPSNLKDAEEKGGWANKAGKAADAVQDAKKVKDAVQAIKGGAELAAGIAAGGFNPETIKGAIDLLGVVKKLLPVLIGILLVAIGGIVFVVLGSFYAPIAFFDTLFDDLNDQVPALDMRNQAALNNMVPNEAKAGALEACKTSPESIICRSRTISETQITRLQRVEIEVTGDKYGDRLAPTSYTYKGKNYDPNEFAKAVQNDATLRQAYKRAFNMKVLGFSDSSFVGNTLARYQGSKKGPTLTGSHEDKVNQLINRTTTDASDSSTDTTVVRKVFIPVDTNSDGTPADGTTYTIEGDTDGEEYSQEDVDAYNEANPPAPDTSGAPSQVGDLLIGSASAFGYWDLACTVKSMVSAASLAAKVANQKAVVNYVQPVAALAYKAKAGDISVGDSDILAEYFHKTDGRKKIESKAAVYADGSVDGSTVTPASGASTMIDNPNYGKTALDSPLFKMSLNHGSKPNTKISDSQYSLGVSVKSLFGGESNSASDTIEALNNVGSTLDDATCAVVQNPVVRGIGIFFGLSGGLISATGTLAIKLPVFINVYNGALTLDKIIQNGKDGKVIPTNLSDSPADLGILGWTYAAGLSGEAAQNRGMVGGNAQEILAYQKLGAESKADYIAIEQQDTSPLDATSKYSFLGSLLLTLSTMTNSPITGGATLGNIASVVAGSAATILSPVDSYAATIDPDRYEYCEDVAYSSVGISADVGCNVRYVMSEADLSLDTYDVQKAMGSTACGGAPCVSNLTTTGYPDGYTQVSPTDAQKFADEFIKGTDNGTYSSRFASGTYDNDYSKFLDFCAYRALPYGQTYSIDGLDEKWQTGEICKSEGAPYSYFRVYTLDNTALDARDAVYQYTSQPTGSLSTGRPANTTDYGNGWILTNGVDYSSAPCDPRTTDVGLYKNPATNITIRVCDTKIAGTKTTTNSLVSTNFMNMYEAAKKDGITFVLAESLRKNGEKYYSTPSRHSMGLAFDLGSVQNGGGSWCYSGPAGSLSGAIACRSNTGPAGTAVRWMDAHAAEYGFQNLNSEPWHWSTGETGGQFNTKKLQ